MKYLLSIGVSVLLATTVALAQTPGTGNTTGAEFEMVTAINTGAADASDKAAVDGDLVTVGMSSPDTSLVGEPLILAAGLAPAGSDPTLPFGMEGNIVGIPFSPYEATILLDGFAPAPFPPVVGFGSTDIGIPIPGAALCSLGMDGIYLQSAAADATKPNGLAFSVALEVAVSPVKTTSLTLGDDDFTQVVLSVTTVNFYGTVYSDFYVGSNGFVTFGAGDTAFSTSETSMLADEPRVAPLWTDLSPQNGSVTVSETCGGVVVVDYDAPSYLGSTGGGGPNLFSTVLSPAGDVLFAWSVVTADAPNFNNDDMTGISPGGGLSLPNDVGVFSALTAPVVGTPFQALYHNYDDLCGDDAEELASGMASFTFDGVDAYTLSATVSTLPASVSGLSPGSGPDTGGTPVTVSGCNLDPMALYELDFVGVGIVPATFMDAMTLTATTLPSPPAVVDVVVLENGLPLGLLPGAFTYICALPTLGPANTLCDPSAVELTGLTQNSSSDVAELIAINNPAGFDFYGVNYTQVYVCSNGYLQFNNPGTDWGESVTDLLNGDPKIAGQWDDLNPGTATTGLVFLDTSVPGSTRICWQGVPEFSNTGANTFVITLTSNTGGPTGGLLTSGTITMDYDLANSGGDFIAGLSPGGGAIGAPIDISCGPNPITVGEAPYQQFLSSDVKDLYGYQVAWTLDSGGFPVLQN